MEKIDQIQEEITKENLEDQIKSKKGVLLELPLENPDPQARVKIFEKKLALD